MPIKACRKCGAKPKTAFKVVAAYKLEADFCQDCYNAWFDLRDKVVEDAFRNFLPVSKSK